MGGERETTLEKDYSSKSKETKLSGFRIHESGGEMHVHDDKNKLKCAIPMGRAYKMWDKVSMERTPCDFDDPVNETTITLESTLENGELDVKISLVPTKVASNYRKLQEFFKRK